MNEDSQEVERKESITQISSSEFNKEVLVMPAEGGHMGLNIFESDHQFDQKLQQLVREKLKKEFNFLSQELLYCGQGIPIIYQVLNQIEKTGNTKTPGGKEIFEMAIQGDPISVKTYEKFLEYLGMSVFTVCNLYMNKDNVVLVGNIINSVYRKLYKGREKEFWERMSKRLLGKSHFTEMYKRMKIFVYKDKDLMGINGIFNYLYLHHIRSQMAH